MATFRQIQDAQRNLGLTQVPISEFAQFVNDTTQSDVASAGIDTGFPLGVKKFSAGFDRLMESTGIPKVSGSVGESIGGFFGAPEAGRAAGEAIPRSLIDFIPAIAGMALLPTPAAPAGLGLIGASAGLSGANAYEKTDSAGQAAFAAGLTAAAGPIGKFGGQLGQKLLPKLSPIVADVIGGQVVGTTAFLGADFANHLAQGGAPADFFTRDTLVHTIVGNLPFAALDAARVTPSIMAKFRSEKDFQVADAAEQAAQNIADQPNSNISVNGKAIKPKKDDSTSSIIDMVDEKPISGSGEKVDTMRVVEGRVIDENVVGGENPTRLKDFSDPGTFYRVVVGDAAFQDIVDRGEVRTNAGTKVAEGGSLQDRLAARPTAFPSFSKGSASISYAKANPDHYIITSTDPSIQPSTKGRHGKGTTMFPTDGNGAPLRSLSGEKVKVYKHQGNGDYKLVYSEGKPVNSVDAETIKIGSVVGAETSDVLGSETPPGDVVETALLAERLQEMIGVRELGRENAEAFRKVAEGFVKEQVGFQTRVNEKLKAAGKAVVEEDIPLNKEVYDKVGEGMEKGQAVEEVVQKEVAKKLTVEERKAKLLEARAQKMEGINSWYEGLTDPAEKAIIDKAIADVSAIDTERDSYGNVMTAAKKWFEGGTTRDGKVFAAREGFEGDPNRQLEKLQAVVNQAIGFERQSSRVFGTGSKLFKEKGRKGTRFDTKEEADAYLAANGDKFEPGYQWEAKARKYKGKVNYEIRGLLKKGQGGAEFIDKANKDVFVEVAENPVPKKVLKKKAETKNEQAAKDTEIGIVHETLEARMDALMWDDIVESTNDMFEFKQDFLTGLEAIKGKDGKEMIDALNKVGLDDPDVQADFWRVAAALKLLDDGGTLKGLEGETDGVAVKRAQGLLAGVDAGDGKAIRANLPKKITLERLVDPEMPDDILYRALLGSPEEIGGQGNDDRLLIGEFSEKPTFAQVQETLTKGMAEGLIGKKDVEGISMVETVSTVSAFNESQGLDVVLTDAEIAYKKNVDETNRKIDEIENRLAGKVAQIDAKRLPESEFQNERFEFARAKLEAEAEELRKERAKLPPNVVKGDFGKGLFGQKIRVGDHLENVNAVTFLKRFFENDGRSAPEVDMLVKDSLKVFRLFELNDDVILGRSKVLKGVYLRTAEGIRRLGLSTELPESLVKFTLAHEGSHGLVDVLERGGGTAEQRTKLNGWKEVTSQMDTRERFEVMKEMQKVSGQDSEQIWSKTLANDDEFMANVLAHASLAVGKKSMWTEFLTHMPKEMGDFLRMVGEWVGKVYNGADALLWSGYKKSARKGFIRDIQNGVDGMVKEARLLDRDVERLMEFQMTMPGGVGVEMMNPTVGREIVGEKNFQEGMVETLHAMNMWPGDSASWFSEMFEPILHFGERKGPAHKRMASMLLEQTEAKNKFRTGVMLELGAELGKDGSWDFPKDSALVRVMGEEKLTKAMEGVLADAISLGQHSSDIDFQTKLKGLSPEEQGVVRSMVTRAETAMQTSLSALLKSAKETYIKGLAVKVVKSVGLKPSAADTLVHQVWDGLEAGDVNMVNNATLRLGALGDIIHGDVRSMVDTLTAQADLFAENPWVMGGEVGSRTSKSVVQAFNAMKAQADTASIEGSFLSLMEAEFQGREEQVNHLQAIMNFADVTGGAAARQIRQADFDLYKLDPDIQADPDGLARFKQAISNFDVPDTELGQRLAKSNFLYFLGGNMGSHIAEAMSPYMILPSFLIEKGTGIINAYKLASGAAKDIGLATITGGKLKDASEAAFIHEVEQRGAIGVGSVSELTNNQIYSAINARRIMDGEKPMSLVDFAKTPLEAVSRMAFKLYGIPTQFNEKTALLAAFRHFNKGKHEVGSVKWNEAVSESIYLAKLSNGSAGRAGRSVGVFSAYKFRTASQAFASLQQFSWGQIASVVRFIEKGYTDRLAKPDKMPAAEWALVKKHSKQAAKNMLVTQMMAAGAMGLPAVGAVMAMIEKYTDWEPNKMLRETLAAIGGKEHGAMLADVSLRGMWHAMPNAPDLGVKFGIGNVLGTDNWNGWSVDGFIGPTASLVQNVLTGTGKLVQGDVAEGAQLLAPAALKRVIQLYRGDGKVRAGSGEALLDPTGMEKGYMALGLNPVRLSKARDRDKVLARSAEIDQRQSIRVYDSIVDKFDKGQVGEARKQMQQYANESGTDIKDVSSRVASRYERQNFVRDPRNKSTIKGSQEAKGFIDTLGKDIREPANEVQRLLARRAVQSQLLGVSRMPSQEELRLAQAVGQLMDKGMTRVEARQRLGGNTWFDALDGSGVQ
jgi:hypothetical protein